VNTALATMQRAFERYFERAIPRANVSPLRLHAAIRYSALSPGKRLRPLLALTGCRAVGGRWQTALPAAAAMECVHAFSLVHDDLPAMDNDDYRRGRLTTHKKFGDALGILAGDALLALAFEELSRLAERGVPAPRVLAAIRVLAHAAGSQELVGGQALDLAAEGRRASREAVRTIHARKTGALIGAALKIGGLVGGAAPPRLAALEAIGRDLGLAFQIHDDLLNRGSSLARLGKRTGTDDARRKATYPRAVGEKRAVAEAARLYLRCLRRVERIGPPAWDLGHLILAVAERES
jgi:geranylgeranyl diphosphate synthase type II